MNVHLVVILCTLFLVGVTKAVFHQSITNLQSILFTKRLVDFCCLFFESQTLLLINIVLGLDFAHFLEQIYSNSIKQNYNSCSNIIGTVYLLTSFLPYVIISIIFIKFSTKANIALYSVQYSVFCFLKIRFERN